MAKLKPSQEKNIQVALSRARSRNASPKVIKSLVEAMGVEANYENLNRGDRDSQGVLQQRPSQGWGPPGSVSRDVDQYLDRAIPASKKYGSAGALAQGVQRSAFPGRYNAKGAEAQSIINQFAPGLGSGGEAPKKYGGSTKTTTTPGTPADPQARNSAILDYFNHRGKPGAILDLKGQLDAAKGVPGTTKTTTTPGGSSPVMKGGGAIADTVIARVSAVDKQHLPYKWGGGHGGKIHPHQGIPVDCSGFVSEVLGVNPRVSGEFGKWGKPGEGGEVTVYSNSHHVLAKVKGKDGKWHFFGTSASNPGGGAGWIEAKKISAQYLKGFKARHA